MDVDSPSDAELISGSQSRPELIGVLYERHAAAVYRYLARRAPRLVAEDLLSEVFVAALTARKRVVLHPSGSALPWLYGIAGNVLHTHLRRAARRGLVNAEIGLDWGAVDDRLVAQSQRTQLRVALGGLSASERDLLLLVAWEGLTPGQAAGGARHYPDSCPQPAASSPQPRAADPNGALGVKQRTVDNQHRLGAQPGEPDMNTVDELLADTATVDDLPAAAETAAHAVLHAAIAMQVLDRRAPLLGARGGHRSRMSTAMLIAAGAAAVIITPVVAVDGFQTTASAATVLHEAGQAAGAQKGGWPDASYWHSVSTYRRDGHTYRREIWIGHHAPSVLRDPGVAPGLIPLGLSAFPAGAAWLTWDQLYALPTDPHQLETTLRADIHGAGNGDDAELFVMIGDLLRESPAAPALREALYDVAAGIPGVRVAGQVTDPQGRTGTGVERDGQLYVIDTTTGQLLDETDSGFQSTYLTQGPTDTAPRATNR